MRYDCFQLRKLLEKVKASRTVPFLLSLKGISLKEMLPPPVGSLEHLKPVQNQRPEKALAGSISFVFFCGCFLSWLVKKSLGVRRCVLQHFT